MGRESRVCELPGVRFSHTASTTTEIIEAGALGWLDMREVRMRNGQMGSPNCPNALVLWSTTLVRLSEMISMGQRNTKPKSTGSASLAKIRGARANSNGTTTLARGLIEYSRTKRCPTGTAN